jgi:enamine deaminase RidA (YjgF/YER057c/UK114 family)
MSGRRTMMKIPMLFAMLAMASCATQAADDVIRYRVANSTVPVAAAVEIPATASLVYLSGKTPPVQHAEYRTDDIRAYGESTRQQAEGIFKAIERSLGELGLGLGDVVKMQVYLVGDPASDGRMDTRGFMEAYVRFFGTEAQPNLPARTLVQIAGLPNPGWRVEIDVVAARVKPSRTDANT